MSEPTTVSVLECGCPTDRRLFLRVGKSVVVSNRLQTQIFGAPLRRPSEWVEEFIGEPHLHVPEVAVWYVHKTEIGLAEAVLIDALQPLRNINDRGYGRPDLWPFRNPDVQGVALCDFEPDRSCRKGVASGSSIRNEPGVYGIYVDPGFELFTAFAALKGLPYDPACGETRRKVRESIRARIRAAKRARDFLRTLPTARPMSQPGPAAQGATGRPLDCSSGPSGP